MTTTHDMDVMSFYRLHAVPVSTFAELGILYALERQVAPTLSWCDAQRHLSVLSNTTSAIVSSGTPFVIKVCEF